MSSNPKNLSSSNDLRVVLCELKSFLESILDTEATITVPHPLVFPRIQKFVQQARLCYESISDEGFIVRNALFAIKPESLKSEALFKDTLKHYATSLTLLNTSRLDRNSIDLTRVSHLLAFVSALINPKDIQKLNNSHS